MAKLKTNRQLLTAMVKEMGDIHLAFVRADLVSKAEQVLENTDRVREEMKHSIIHPDLWIRYNEEIVKLLGEQN